MITINDLSLRLGANILFDSVNLKFEKGNCYGIIGANGSGKSTFLKLLNQELESTSGNIIIKNNLKIKTLLQDHFKYQESIVLDVLLMEDKKLYDVYLKREKLYNKSNLTGEEVLKLADLENEFYKMDGYKIISDASILLASLGLENELHFKKMKELKNTLKVKVLLAKCLFSKPDILLLDEPTNDLDLKTINLLIEILKKNSNCIILVSHDRYFLNSCCTHIIEIENKKMNLYKGNYDYYLKTSNKIKEQKLEENKKKLKQQEELKEFINRFGSNASLAGLATSRKKILDKIEFEDVKSLEKEPLIEFLIDTKASGEVLKVNNLTLVKNKEVLLDNISFTIYSCDKINIIGTSLQKKALFDVLSGEIKPTKGSIIWNNKIKISYFKNENDSLNIDTNMLDYLKNKFIDLDTLTLRKTLAKMNFKNDDVFKPLKVLSGGEKVRFKFLNISLERANFIILDDPTNHLDIKSIKSLNNALVNYEGVVIFTTQDYELNKSVGNRLIEILDNGSIKEHFDNKIEISNK